MITDTTHRIKKYFRDIIILTLNIAALRGLHSADAKYAFYNNFVPGR